MLFRLLVVVAVFSFTRLSVAQETQSLGQPESQSSSVHPTEIPNLVAFWDFQEPAGTSRKSQGKNSLSLKEQNGPIARVEGGVFGPYAARIRQGQWFMIDRPDLGPLDIHGPDAQVTVVAWVRRKATSYWQAVAGVWDETRGKRQYCLFLNAPRGTRASEMVRYPLKNRVHGHVSNVGGPTAPHKYCITYSSGASEIPLNEWTCIAMSYDGMQSRVYVNGELDALDDYNPFSAPGGLFDGKETGSPFTVGAVHRSNEWGNFFGGDIGGLAVYDRALTADEFRHLMQATDRHSD